MAGRVTMADVAAAAGVSAKTVSNVLGDRGGYSPETGARVLAAVAGLGYRLNADARALRSRRSGVIALALPYVPYSSVLGFVPLPAPLLMAVIGLTLLYVLVTELAKRRFYARMGDDRARQAGAAPMSAS